VDRGKRAGERRGKGGGVGGRKGRGEKGGEVKRGGNQVEKGSKASLRRNEEALERV